MSVDEETPAAAPAPAEPPPAEVAAPPAEAAAPLPVEAPAVQPPAAAVAPAIPPAIPREEDPFSWRYGWSAEDQQTWKRVLQLTVAAIAARLLFVLVLHRPIDFNYSDMGGYIERARWLADPRHESGDFEWYYPAGTSMALAGFLKVFGGSFGFTVAAAFQAIASGLETLLVFIAGRRFFSRQVALGAAVLWATHWLSFSYAGFFLSENWLLIALTLALALFREDRPERALATGVVLGFGAWAKSQAVLLVPLWGLLLIARKRTATAIALGIGAAVVVLPVSAFVSDKTGQRAFISTNGGQTFALAHCPIREIGYHDAKTNTGAAFTLPVLNQRIARGEVEGSWGEARYTEPFVNSAWYMQRGWECIRRYPEHVARMALTHVADTFSGWPWSPTFPWPDFNTRWRWPVVLSNLFIAYLIAPLALAGLWWRRREPGLWWLFGLPLISVLGSAVLFHGDSRFRMPYDFTFFLAAAAGFETWWLKRKAARAP